MRVEPASTKLSGSEAAPGAVFTVEIVVEGVTNLGAFEFTITTDTTFFKYGDFSVAPFFNSSGRSASCLQRVGTMAPLDSAALHRGNHQAPTVPA